MPGTPTARNGLETSASSDLYQVTRSANNTNAGIIDLAIAKSQWDGGAVPPDGDNDSSEGYAKGSKWLMDAGIYVCVDPSVGEAVWRLIWPADPALAYTKVCGEDATGMITGTTLTIPQTPITNTYRLFKNGVRLKEAAGDGFTRTGTAVTLTTAKVSGDWYCQDYEYSA